MVIKELLELSAQKDSAVSIGVFDGVHLGHQKLLLRTKAEAEARGLLSAVVTFRNHPRSVLTPGFEPRYLMTLERRVEAIKSLGIDEVVAIEFTHGVSQVRAREFASLLRDHVRMRLLVVGPDFALGNKREGNIATLSLLGKEMGFGVVCACFVHREGQVVSSTAIREALAQGDVSHAKRLLGRPFTLCGPVVVGDRRGKLLGYATANLEIDEGCALPADGVYATRAHCKGAALDSITYIGVRPTFDGVRRTKEVHIFDFDEVLYGEEMTVDFICQLRGDIRFSGSDELIQQMNLDSARAREILAKA